MSDDLDKLKTRYSEINTAVLKAESEYTVAQTERGRIHQELSEMGFDIKKSIPEQVQARKEALHDKLNDIETTIGDYQESESSREHTRPEGDGGGGSAQATD